MICSFSTYSIELYFNSDLAAARLGTLSKETEPVFNDEAIDIARAHHSYLHDHDMLSSSRTPHNTTRSKPCLEIIPDTRFIVFHGSEHEATPVKLKGIVRLTVPESMSILKPSVKLDGKRKISWYYNSTGLSGGEISNKNNFWLQEQRLGGVESAHKIKAGTIEWPFEFELSPAMPESVEGLHETYVAYHIHASVLRSGWASKAITAQEHIRIVRTLGQASMETTRSRVNSDIWSNKISYSISIPSDAIVFGTSITADVELSPIKKGLKMGRIELRLVETVVKRLNLESLPDGRGERTKSEETEVANETLDFPEASRVQYNDETNDNPMLADEMYKFKATLPLPKSLNTCRQDVDSHQLNVTHRFKIMVNLHNPEGHVSQLVCRLPVKIFISPNLPLDESNNVMPAANGMTDETLNANETSLSAPPQYGLHQLDQVFSDMDPAGYMSRAPSVPGSPSGLGTQSRRGSEDNLASLNGLAEVDPNGDIGSNHGSVQPSLLRLRLADLQDGAPSALSASPGGSGGNSPAPGLIRNGSSGHLSRSAQHASSLPSSSLRSPATGLLCRTSDDPQDDPAQLTVYNLNDLSRVPSYGAAVRTPGAVTPYSQGPPSYIDATSRPPSPGSEIERPGQVSESDTNG